MVLAGQRQCHAWLSWTSMANRAEAKKAGIIGCAPPSIVERWKVCWGKHVPPCYHCLAVHRPPAWDTGDGACESAGTSTPYVRRLCTYKHETILMPIGEIGLAPETRNSDRSGSSEACASTSAPHTCHGNFHELRECRAASPETRGNETVDGFPMPMPMSCAGRGGRPGSPGSDQPGRRPALSVLLHHNGSRKNSPPHCCYFGYEARAVYVGACDDEISAQRAEGLGLAAAACLCCCRRLCWGTAEWSAREIG